MKELLCKVVSLIFENSCLICNNSAKDFEVCKTCENNFVIREQNYLKQLNELNVLSWGLYDGKLRQGIISLKSGNKKLANYFSKKLVEFWNKVKYENKNYLVIPVPSHKKRIKERGFCQSSIIAKEFAEALKFDFSNNIIVRRKETKYMNSLSNLNERLENIKNAFEVAGLIPKEKNLLLVDDILTSGSTMCELAKTIYKKYPDINLTGLTVASGDTYTIPL